MAILTHGPLGNFTGSIGNITGSIWKGKQVIRQRQKSVQTRQSDVQIRQQIKFSLIMKMLQPATGFLRQSFSKDPAHMTRFNKAFSLNYRNAITGNYPDFRIDYSKAILGRGNLPGVVNVSGLSSSGGRLECRWTNFSFYGNARTDDRAWLVTYCERLNHWSYHLGIADRVSGMCYTEEPELSGESLQVYLGFISVDGKRSSDSQYVGLIQLL